MSAITAYPLAWPAGWKRTASVQRRYGRFGTGETVRIHETYSRVERKPITIAQSTDRLLRELERMGIPARDVIISTNLELRLDGLPRSGQRRPEDPGAAIYWRDGAEQRCMATDLYTTVEDNLAALAATIEAMRAIERHGGAQILNRAFAGFAALPAPGQTTARGWREVLGVTPDENSLAIAQKKYRRLAAVHHPDRGGTSEAMAELNWAWAQAQEALK